MSGLVLESGIFDVLLEHVRFDVPESLVLTLRRTVDLPQI